MKIVLQRVKNANVSIKDEIVGSVGKGYMLLVGINCSDTVESVKKMARKIANLRVFEDEFGKMNLNISQVEGKILSISQFTLYGDTQKGNRPGFKDAAQPEYAERLYDLFNEELRSEYGLKVETGNFGCDMQVMLVNDGPVTFIVEV